MVLPKEGKRRGSIAPDCAAAHALAPAPRLRPRRSTSCSSMAFVFARQEAAVITGLMERS